MELSSTLLIAIALAMDAFTVSISGGASLKKVKIIEALLVALYFGLFQFFMPLLGWKGGLFFSDLINSFDHFIYLFFDCSRINLHSLWILPLYSVFIIYFVVWSTFFFCHCYANWILKSKILFSGCLAEEKFFCKRNSENMVNI